METIDGITLRSLTVLDAVAREGSFSAAGRRLGLTRAAVSRVVAQLEAQLGVRLFRRTTRRVALTEAAEQLVARLGPGLAQIRQALAIAGEDERRLGGSLRLTSSAAFGRHYVLPSVAAFVARHPAVRAEVQLGDDLDDLLAEGIDLAVRIGPLPPSSMIARSVGRLALALVAAPALLAAHGRPTTVAALARVPAVGFRVPGTGAVYPWSLAVGGQRRELAPARVAVLSNAIDGVADLARLGCGAAMVPRYLVAEDVAAGRLVTLLEEAVLPGPEVHLCFVEREMMPARVRALVSHLSADLSRRLQGGARRSRA